MQVLIKQKMSTVVDVSVLRVNNITFRYTTHTLTLTARGSTLDVCRRQILTNKVDPRNVRLEIFLMAVDP